MSAFEDGSEVAEGSNTEEQRESDFEGVSGGEDEVIKIQIGMTDGTQTNEKRESRKALSLQFFEKLFPH